MEWWKCLFRSSWPFRPFKIRPSFIPPKHGKTVTRLHRFIHHKNANWLPGLHHCEDLKARLVMWSYSLLLRSDFFLITCSQMAVSVTCARVIRLVLKLFIILKSTKICASFPVFKRQWSCQKLIVLEKFLSLYRTRSFISAFASAPCRNIS
jgi:hypothetical protein